LDAVLVERITEAGTQTVAHKVIPTTQVCRRAAPLLRNLRQEIPQAAAEPRWPFVSLGIQGDLQGLGQLLRCRLWFTRLMDVMNEAGSLLCLALGANGGDAVGRLAFPRFRLCGTVFLHDIPHVEFKPPAVVALLRYAP